VTGLRGGNPNRAARGKKSPATAGTEELGLSEGQRAAEPLEHGRLVRVWVADAAAIGTARRRPVPLLGPLLQRLFSQQPRDLIPNPRRQFLDLKKRPSRIQLLLLRPRELLHKLPDLRCPPTIHGPDLLSAPF